MKKWGALVLVFILTMHTFSELAIFLSFKLNQTKIIELFCINKDEPELKCNGKCHLTSVLEENRDLQDSPISNTYETKEVITLFFNALAVNEYQQQVKTILSNYYDHFVVIENELNSIFHPPQG